MRLAFADFELDVPRRILSRDGQPVPLQPRVFDLLVHLVEQRDRVASKTELLETLWGQVVTPGVLTTAFRSLRIALQEDAKQPRLIRTVHAVGYQFIGEVRAADSAPLRQMRHANFVGRQAELDALDEFAASDQVALYLEGIPGAGKTCLLDAWVYRRHREGRSTLWLDGRQLSVAPAAFIAELEAALSTQPANAPVVFDAYDFLLSIDGWIRTDVLSRLAPRKVIFAARAPRPRGWASDAASAAFSHIRLSGIEQEAAMELLVRAGSSPEHASALATKVEGHALSLRLLSLLDDETREGCLPCNTLPLPDLTDAFASGAPSERHRLGLDALALIPGLEQSHLETLLDGPATQVFEWLASLPFVELSRRGLEMHAVASAAILDRLKTAHPARVREWVSATMRVFVQAMAATDDVREHVRLSTAAMALMRVQPELAKLYDDRARALSVELSQGNPEAFLDLVHSQKGKAMATICQRWLELRDVSQLWLIKDGDELVGGTLQLTLMHPEEHSEFDPLMKAICETLRQADGSCRPTLVHRVLVSTEGETVCPAFQRCHDVLNVNHHTLMDGEIRDSFVVYEVLEPWEWMANSVGFERNAEADVEGRRHVSFYRYFAGGVRAWTEVVLRSLTP